MVLKILLDDLHHREVLKDATVSIQFHAPEIRNNLCCVVGRGRIDGLEPEGFKNPMKKMLGPVRETDGDSHFLPEQGARINVGILRLQLKLHQEGL